LFAVVLQIVCPIVYRLQMAGDNTEHEDATRQAVPLE